MDKSIRKYDSIDAMKAAEYRYWQSVSARERLDAVWSITVEQYALKGVTPDAPRLRRTLVRLKYSQGRVPE